MKNMPFTKILLHVDSGFGDLRGTGFAVEYDILHRKLIWRRLDKGVIDSINKPFKEPITIGAAAGLSGLFTLISSSTEKKTAMERLGDSYIIIPVLIGIIFFLIIEYISMRNRNSLQIIDPPALMNNLPIIMKCMR